MKINLKLSKAYNFEIDFLLMCYQFSFPYFFLELIPKSLLYLLIFLQPTWAVFPILATPNTSIKSRYDVVVVGSGYGGSIAASRCARAGQSVCVLEKGKEWRPGDFSEDFKEVATEFQVTVGGLEQQFGKQS